MPLYASTAASYIAVPHRGSSEGHSRAPRSATHQGRLLLSGVIRPGRMHDQTAVKTEGITEQLRLTRV